MGLMIPFKCGLHMQRLWPGGRGVLVRCWFSVDPASRRWVGIETTVGRRPVYTVCFVCPLSTRRWPFVWGDTRLDDGGSALTQLLVRVSSFMFILLQSGNGILVGGAFVQQRPDAGPTFQILARLWPGLGECPVLLTNHLISISLLGAA